MDSGLVQLAREALSVRLTGSLNGLPPTEEQFKEFLQTASRNPGYERSMSVLADLGGLTEQAQPDTGYGRWMQEARDAAADFDWSSVNRWFADLGLQQGPELIFPEGLTGNPQRTYRQLLHPFETIYLAGKNKPETPAKTPA